MEIYQFNKEVGKKITKFDSDFVMSRITQTDKVAHIGCVHLDEDGLIGYHQAVVSQLLVVVNGEGWVRGEIRCEGEKRDKHRGKSRDIIILENPWVREW